MRSRSTDGRWAGSCSAPISRTRSRCSACRPFRSRAASRARACRWVCRSSAGVAARRPYCGQRRPSRRPSPGPRTCRRSCAARADEDLPADPVRIIQEEAMGTNRRINVASGRTVEKLAHYSRALRVGDMVLPSGTTAIDRQGNVRGVGDVAKQVESIMTIAERSLGKAGGKLADVVRSRTHVTDIRVGDGAARTLARYLRDARPAATLVQVNGLARPEQLLEIELYLVSGARAAP